MAGRKLEHLSVWDGVPGVGGASRVAFLTDLTGFRRTRKVGAAEEWSVQIGPDSNAWGELTEERVLQGVWVDPDTQAVLETAEARIRRPAQVLERGGERRQQVAADGLLLDLLHNATLIEKVEANGDIRRRFTIELILPEKHLTDIILPNAPSYVSLGTVEPGEPVTITYDNDHPLTAAQELAKVATFGGGQKGAELRLRRAGAGDYRLDLVGRIGSDTISLRVEDAKNLLSVTRDTDSGKIGTRIYPIGGTNLGEEGSMADAEWQVASGTAATLTMVDPIIGEDDQLNGLTLQDFEGDFHTIADTTAPRTVVLDSDPGKTLRGTLVRFKRPVTGPSGTVQGKLSYLESPDAIDRWGVTKSVRLERPDIPNIDNLVPNPALREWSGGRPVRWRSVGSPGLSRNTDLLYWRSGESSARLQALEGSGIETEPFRVFPTARDPFFVAMARLWPVSGHVRLEIHDVTNDQIFPGEDQGDAVTVATGRWIESFGVGPGGQPDDNFFTRETAQFIVRLIARGGPAEWYLDMVQMTQTPSFVEFFYEGRASNDLWMLAKRGLDEVDEPAEAYRVNFVDIGRLGETPTDGEPYVEGVPELGSNARVREETLDVDFTSRILEMDTNELVEGDTKVTLEERTNDLTRLLGEPSRRGRIPVQTEEGEDVPLGDCTNLIAPGTDTSEFCSPDGSGRHLITTYPPIDPAEAELEGGEDIAWGWDGKVEFTGTGGGDEPTGGETNPDSTLKRATLGTAYVKDFLGSLLPPGAEWIVRQGTWEPTFDGLASLGDPALLELDASAISFLPAADMVVQQTYELTSDRGKAEVFGRFSWGGGSIDGYELEADEDDNHQELNRYSGGAKTVLDVVGEGPEETLVLTHKLHVEGSTQRGWAETSSAGVVELAGSDGTVSGTATAAIGSENAFSEGVYHRRVVVCPSNEITVNGLPTGWKVKTSAQVLADATVEGGAGTAVHDIGGQMMALGGAVEVYDDTGELRAELNPAGGIIGGDVYELDTGAVSVPEDSGTGETETPVPGTAVSSVADGAAQHDVSVTIGADEDYLLAGVSYEGGEIQSVTIDPGGADEAAFTEEVRSTAHGHASIWSLRGADVPASGSYTVRLATDGAGVGMLTVVPVAFADDAEPEVRSKTSFTDKLIVSREVLTQTDDTLLFDTLYHTENNATLTPDPGQTELTEDSNPGGDMTGGTSWELDTEHGEHITGWGFGVEGSGDYVVVGLRPAKAGSLSGDSGFDLGASLEMSFLDADGIEILNTESFVEPVRTTEYSRGRATTQIPEGTDLIVPYALRKGDAQGIACVRRPQVNRGTVPCEFREEAGAHARVPTDQDLVAYYPCDGEGYVESDYDGWQQNETTVRSRRVWDFSGRENHALIYQDFSSFLQAPNWLQRAARGASFKGLEHTSHQGDFSDGVIILDTEPENAPTPYYDHEDFQQNDDLVVCAWINPFMFNGVGGDPYELPHQTDDGSYLWGNYYHSDEIKDGLQYRHAGFHLSLLDGVQTDSFNGGRGFTMTVGTPDEGHTLMWPFDWTFGMELVQPDYMEAYWILEQPIFVAMRISPATGGTVDIDVFCGAGHRSDLVRMSPALHPDDPSLGATTPLVSAYSVPAINEHEENGAIRWAWVSKALEEVRWDDGKGDDPGTVGRWDEMRRYNRALVDQEIRGLFLNPSATTMTTTSPESLQRSASGGIVFDPSVSGLRPPSFDLDTCAGGSGLDVTAEWDPPLGVDASTHEIRIQYYEDDVANGSQYTGIDPEAGTHTHNLAGVGSDAGSTSNHDWHYEVELVRLSDSTVVDSHTSTKNDQIYGTC